MAMDQELKAITRMLAILEPLEPPARDRVIAYVLDRASPEARDEAETRPQANGGA